MAESPNRISRAIRAFVDSPITILVKGLILFFIGLSEASRTVWEDISQKQLRVGHGLVIIGFFNILDAIPHLIDGVEATVRFREAREPKDARTKDDRVAQESLKHPE